MEGDVETLLHPLVARFEPASHPALHPGRMRSRDLGTECIGWVGELHPRWQQKVRTALTAVCYELDAAALLTLLLPDYREVSKFPPACATWRGTCPNRPLTKRCSRRCSRPDRMPFRASACSDVYRGKGMEAGRKSVAFRVLCNILPAL